MKNLFKRVVAALFVLTAVLSCSRLEVTLPKGPQGEQGPKGDPGESPDMTVYATRVWVQEQIDAITNADTTRY